MSIFIKRNLSNTSILGLLGFFAVISVYAAGNVSFSMNNVDFILYQGNQTDISHSLVAVANDMNSYNEIMKIIPSMDGEIPTYNENEETIILVVTHSKDCLYSYYVSSVQHQIWYFSNFNEENFRIVLDKNTTTSSANCNTVVDSIYNYTFVKIKKTNRPIGLDVINSDAQPSNN